VPSKKTVCFSVAVTPAIGNDIVLTPFWAVDTVTIRAFILVIFRVFHCGAFDQGFHRLTSFSDLKLLTRLLVRFLSYIYSRLFFRIHEKEALESPNASLKRRSVNHRRASSLSNIHTRQDNECSRILGHQNLHILRFSLSILRAESSCLFLLSEFQSIRNANLEKKHRNYPVLPGENFSVAFTPATFHDCVLARVRLIVVLIAAVRSPIIFRASIEQNNHGFSPFVRNQSASRQQLVSLLYSHQLPQ
jgi:hypothetical protein